MSERFSVADRLDRLPISNYHRFICIILFISWFCEMIDLGGTGFLMPVIIKHFGLTTVQGGYFSSTAYLGMMIGSMAAGAISDKLGRKKVVIICMAVWGVGGMFMAFAQNLPWLFAARFILGLGLGAQVPVAMAYISEVLPTRSRAKYMTLYQVMGPFGIAFAGLLTVIFLPLGGWRVVYFVEALPALSLFLILKYCPESCFWLESQGRFEKADKITDQWEARVMESFGGKELPPVIVRKAVYTEPGKISDLFKRNYVPILLMCVIWMSFCQGSDYGLATWLTQLLMAKGFTIVKATGFVTIGILGGVPAWFFTAWATEKLGRKWSILLCAILTAVFAYLYGASTSIAMLIIFGACYQFGKCGLAMSNAAYTPELFETRLRATGCGFALGCGRLGSIIAPIFLAWVMSTFGANATFYVAAGMAAVAGTAVMILGPETKGKALK